MVRRLLSGVKKLLPWLLLLGIGLFGYTRFVMESNNRELRVIVWGNYLPDKIMAEFEQKYQCHLAIDSIDSNDTFMSRAEMLGIDNWDVIIITQHILERLNEEGLLLPIDGSRIACDAIGTKYMECLPDYVTFCKEYTVPYTASASTLIVHTSHLAGNPADMSWGILLDDSIYKRFSLLKESREVISIALMYLGYSPNTSNIQELDQAEAVLKSMRDRVLKIDSEWFFTGIALEELIVGHCDRPRVGEELAIDGSDVEIVYPREGVVASLDGISISAKAIEIDLAYEFINFLLSQKNIQEVCNANAVWTIVNIPGAPFVKNQLPKPVWKNMTILRHVSEVAHRHKAMWCRFLFNLFEE